MIKEHFSNMNKIYKLALIDLKKIYKGAALGWVWLIAKPAVNILIYWFLFAVGLRVGTSVNGYPYFIWLILGLLPWFYITDIISGLPGSYKKYNYLVNKIKFPISIIPTFMSLSRFIVNIILTLIVLIIYFVVTGNFMIKYISLILYLVLMFIFMSVIGNIISLISGLSKDIGNLIKTIQTPLMVLSPIFWDINNMNITWIGVIQIFNPIAYFVTGFRDVFIYDISIFSKPLELFVMLLLLTLLIMLNIKLHNKIYKNLPDYL